MKQDKKKRMTFKEKIEHAYILRYQHGWTLDRIASEFGVSRRTIQRWLFLYENKESKYWSNTLATRERQRTYGEETRSRIMFLRSRVPDMPATAIHRRLKKDLGDTCPSVQTIRRVLREVGLARERKVRRKNYIKFERDFPNDLWQIDFKGWNGFGELGKLYLLAILDDQSRFIVAAQWLRSQEEVFVLRLLRRAFEEQGLPNQILSDNGSQFKNIRGSQNTTRYYRLLMFLDVEPIYHKPRHPQAKGKLERWFGTVQSNFIPGTHEIVESEPGITVQRFNEYFQEWVEWYNFKHAHSSLDGQPPAKVYLEHMERVERPLKVAIDWDRWSGSRETRRVSKQGEVSVDGCFYTLPDGHAGKKVEIRKLEGIVEVFDGDTRIERFDVDPAATAKDSRKVSKVGTFKYKRRTYNIGYKHRYKKIYIQESADGRSILVYENRRLITRLDKTEGKAY